MWTRRYLVVRVTIPCKKQCSLLVEELERRPRQRQRMGRDVDGPQTGNGAASAEADSSAPSSDAMTLAVTKLVTAWL